MGADLGYDLNSQMKELNFVLTGACSSPTVQPIEGSGRSSKSSSGSGLWFSSGSSPAATVATVFVTFFTSLALFFLVMGGVWIYRRRERTRRGSRGHSSFLSNSNRIGRASGGKGDKRRDESDEEEEIYDDGGDAGRRRGRSVSPVKKSKQGDQRRNPITASRRGTTERPSGRRTDAVVDDSVGEMQNLWGRIYGGSSGVNGQPVQGGRRSVRGGDVELGGRYLVPEVQDAVEAGNRRSRGGVGGSQTQQWNREPKIYVNLETDPTTAAAALFNITSLSPVDLLAEFETEIEK